MKLCWFDCETTGLDPNKDSILEVALAFADLLDPFNVQHVFQAVMWFHPDLIKQQDPYIIDMHTKNRLFEECGAEKAHDTFEVEDALLQLVPMIENKDDKPVLAGSSIHFDHAFINVHMPRLAKRLSHRHYDVSALKLFCESQGMPKLRKAEAHRAKDDIDESVAHAAECKRWLRKNLQ
jgi:oligoribonuclease